MGHRFLLGLCLFYSPILFAQTEPPLLQIAPKKQIDDPLLLHADAMLAEADKHYDKAIQLLQRAFVLAPDDPLIAYDLVRVLKTYGNSKDPLGSLTLKDQNQYKILEQQLQEQEKAQKSSLFFNGYVVLGSQFDSNVSVLPNDNPSHLEGGRLTLDSSLSLGGSWGKIKLIGNAGFNLSYHMNNRDALALYDVGAATAGLRAYFPFHSLFGIFSDFNGTLIYIDDFNAEFMREIAGRIGSYWQYKNLQATIFTLVAGRDFIEFNTEDEPNDRDGARLNVGGSFDFNSSLFTSSVQGGFQQEFAEGFDQRERGPFANVILTLRLGNYEISPAFYYQQRDYYNSSTGRKDERLMPSLTLAYVFTHYWKLTFMYQYTHNFSQDAFAYTRHLGQIGMEWSW